MARISSLAEAIRSSIQDGDTVALEGFTHLIPHAAGHEIIRQGRKGLTVIRSRISSLAEAIRSSIQDGDTVALEGFTHLIPHAAGHEIIRQGRKGLTLIRMTPDIVYDQMIGAGCAAKLI